MTSALAKPEVDLPSDELPSTFSSRALPLPGEFVGPYRLIFELAAGGMATIYVALADRRAGAHRLVAVKRLHRHLAADPNFRKMFLDEARIASHIRHPNVCAVFDYDEHDGTPYIVMEYLAGEPVSAVWRALPRGGSEDEKRRRCVLAARVVADACEALHSAHELCTIYGEPLNVVHRDVSPENLVITYDGVVKLCDFGIAIAERQEHETEAGMLKGKYAYIQPEALRGERPDRRSDIFSLGVVLWELMTGERLFRRDSAIETLRAVGEGVVPPPSTVLGVESEFDGAVLRALAMNPNERFASAREFGKALDEALASARCCSGLGEIARWMEELFPGGRTKKEQTIDLVATLYDPDRSAGRRWTDTPCGEMSETMTVAAATAVPVRPISKTWNPSLAPSLVPPSATKWRRPVFTFALGALLGAQYLSPPKPAWSSAQIAQPTVVASNNGASRVVPPSESQVVAPVANREASRRSGNGERTTDDSVSCDVKVADAPRESDNREAEASTDSSKAKRGRRARPGGDRAAPKAPASVASSPSLMPPPRQLELGSEFTAYAPMRLPPSLLTTQRSVSSDVAVR